MNKRRRFKAKRQRRAQLVVAHVLQRIQQSQRHDFRMSIRTFVAFQSLRRESELLTGQA